MENKQNYIFKKLNNRMRIAFLVMFTIFFLVQVYYTSKVGTKSAEIEQIRIEKDQLRLENEIINSKISEAMSLTKIEEQVKAMGLVQKIAEELTEPANNLAVN
jgi:hypothetical protein